LGVSFAPFFGGGPSVLKGAINSMWHGVVLARRVRAVANGLLVTPTARVAQRRASISQFSFWGGVKCEF
jgi:hypothetical protein